MSTAEASTIMDQIQQAVTEQRVAYDKLMQQNIKGQAVIVRKLAQDIKRLEQELRKEALEKKNSIPVKGRKEETPV